MKRWSERISGWCVGALDNLFPPLCVGCESERCTRAVPLCDRCVGVVELVGVSRCPRCARRYATGPAIECGICSSDSPQFALTFAYAVHAGPIADAVAKFKYGGAEDLGVPMATLVQRAIGGERFDAVVPVPLHEARLRERGFNQSFEIARRLGTVGPVYARALVRVRDTPRQAGLSARERRENVRGAFDVATSFRRRCVGFRALLVDDVLTTGATARECARVLIGAGAREVCVAVVTRAE